MGSLPCAWQPKGVQQPWAEPSLGSSSGNPSRDAEAAGEFPPRGRGWGEFNSSAKAECLQDAWLLQGGQDGAQSPPSLVIPADTCFLPQAEIVKRLSAICAQIIPFLTQEVRRRGGGSASDCSGFLGRGKSKSSLNSRRFWGRKPPCLGWRGGRRGCAGVSGAVWRQGLPPARSTV